MSDDFFFLLSRQCDLILDICFLGDKLDALYVFVLSQILILLNCFVNPMRTDLALDLGYCGLFVIPTFYYYLTWILLLASGRAQVFAVYTC